MSGLLTILTFTLALAGCEGGSVFDGRADDVAPSCAAVTAPDEDWRAGCATRRNLAALTANPDDLVVSRREAPRDAMRRDTLLSNYAQSRAGASTQGSGGTTSSIKTQTDK